MKRAGSDNGLELELVVQAVRIARAEQEAPQVEQVGVCHDALDQPHAEAATARLRQHEDVAQPAEGRVVGHHAREAELALALVDAEDQRVGDRAFDDRRAAGRWPSRPPGQEVGHQVDVETGWIRAHGQPVAMPLEVLSAVAVVHGVEATGRASGPAPASGRG